MASAGPFGALRWRSIGPARGGRFNRGGGQRRAPERVLLRRDRRRPLEDDRRRHHLAAGHRRPDPQLVGRRRRRRPVQPRHRLHRASARSETPRQHHPGRRRLQVDRRRQDAGRTSAWPTRRPSRRSASIRPTPTSSTSRRSATTPAPNPERGVFRSKDGGKTWEKILFRDDKTGAIDLVLDPNNPHVLSTPRCGRRTAIVAA